MEAGVEHLRLVARDDNVRLERRKATLDDLASQSRDVLIRASFGVPVASHARALVVPQWDQYTGTSRRSGPPKSS